MQFGDTAEFKYFKSGLRGCGDHPGVDIIQMRNPFWIGECARFGAADRLVARVCSVAARKFIGPDVSNARTAVTPDKKKWGVTYL
jgi:hypothetical protein